MGGHPFARTGNPGGTVAEPGHIPRTASTRIAYEQPPPDLPDRVRTTGRPIAVANDHARTTASAQVV